MRPRIMPSALLILLALTAVFSSLAAARQPAPPLRPGAYYGHWANDNVRFTIDRMDPQGRFSGHAAFAYQSNFPGYRFDFTGRLAPDGSLMILREWNGGFQVASAGPPQPDGRFLVWQGALRGTGLGDETFDLAVAPGR